MSSDPNPVETLRLMAERWKNDLQSLDAISSKLAGSDAEVVAGARASIQTAFQVVNHAISSGSDWAILQE